MAKTINRRQLLRGAFNGSAVAVGLPVLNCLLNENGNAYADGRALPVRFGVWSWGCGMTPGRWVPETTGLDCDFPTELQAANAYKDYLNIYSGFDALLDGNPNRVHHSGMVSIRTGTAPKKSGNHDVPTLDLLIADKVGTNTRFKTLDITATGNKADSYSGRSSRNMSLPETNAAQLYARVFGSDFRDPNSEGFTPDPKVMSEKSVLSAVKEDREKLMRNLPAEDRLRMDEYFTALRQVENQLALQLQEPAPAEACILPEAPAAIDEKGYEVEHVRRNHKVMAQLLGMALACRQTNVFNMVFSNSFSGLHRAGGSSSQHLYTHEEIIDRELGYQVEASRFVEANMQGWADFLEVLTSIREGDGTLLDNSLVFAHSDTSFAKIHSVQGIPMMSAGSAGGRIKTGIHIATNGDPVSRVGLTMQQAMGLSVAEWGTRSMKTSSPLNEIFV